MSVSLTVGDVRRIAHGPMRTLFLGQFINALGNGLTLALLIVYLSKVRGFPLEQATALLAWQAVLALAVSPLAGTLVDRFGPRPVLMGAALMTAVGILAYGFVDTLAEAFVAMTVVAIAGAGIWGPSSALTARLVAPADRATAFGFGFMLLNLGLGLGGLISSRIVDEKDPSTFTRLYTMTSVAYVALFIAVLSMGRVGGPPPAPEPGADGATTSPAAGEGGWREVLRDRTLLRFVAAGLLMLTFGYGSIDAGVAVFIVDFVKQPVSLIGIVFAANTAVIVLSQLFVISIVKGRSRARVLAGVGVMWALSWLLFGSALNATGWLAVGALIAAMAVFALGETMWSPTAPALLNDLAPEHLRGRYNAFQSVLWGVSGALGPLLTGVLLGSWGGLAWTLTLAAGCLVAALIALRLRRHLTAQQDGLTGPTGSPDDEPEPALPQGDPSLGPAMSTEAR
ncbi:MAG: MFS transporter [Candidatus Nanopelagicales bacterium]|jgi:MFS family permease|nr:MFS transporter [Candidatus Nanopelagicales bacterium]